MCCPLWSYAKELNEQWHYRFEDVDDFDNNSINDILVDGNYYVTVSSFVNTSNNVAKGIISKFEASSGKLVWTREYVGDVYNGIVFKAIDKTSNGYVVIGSSFFDKEPSADYKKAATLLWYDNEGNILNSRTLPDNIATSLNDIATTNEGYVAVGFVNEQQATLRISSGCSDSKGECNVKLSRTFGENINTQILKKNTKGELFLSLTYKNIGNSFYDIYRYNVSKDYFEKLTVSSAIPSSNDFLALDDDYFVKGSNDHLQGCVYGYQPTGQIYTNNFIIVGGRNVGLRKYKTGYEYKVTCSVVDQTSTDELWQNKNQVQNHILKSITRLDGNYYVLAANNDDKTYGIVSYDDSGNEIKVYESKMNNLVTTKIESDNDRSIINIGNIVENNTSRAFIQKLSLVDEHKITINNKTNDSTDSKTYYEGDIINLKDLLGEYTEISITDANGNKIEFSDGLLVMPGCDIIITITTDVKENPKTGNVISILLGTAGVIGSGIILNYTKKKNKFIK